MIVIWPPRGVPPSAYHTRSSTPTAAARRATTSPRHNAPRPPAARQPTTLLATSPRAADASCGATRGDHHTLNTTTRGHAERAKTHICIHQLRRHRTSTPYDKSNPAFAWTACSSFSRSTRSLLYRGSCGLRNECTQSLAVLTMMKRVGAHLEQVHACARGRQPVLVRASVADREVRHELLEPAAHNNQRLRYAWNGPGTRTVVAAGCSSSRTAGAHGAGPA